MNSSTRWLIALLLGLFLLGSLGGQQAHQPKPTLDDRLAEIEARLTLVEETVAALRPAEDPGSAVEAKLDRLEARVVRLEASPAAAAPVGTSRLMESRIRSLERQVARLRSQ